ncbi:MAG: 23S rRNA pseudouridine(2604) synthase RluF [Methanomassiliicoccaceae archaeon]|nr:23S rRNA pseudouridine(2604) synthase RluF [Methanomassiliicoccaceae archaeon]
MIPSDTVRINKFISDSGFCSRREADRMIEEGRVTVDGAAAVTGMTVSGEQDIRVDNKRINSDKGTVLIAVNKPKGIVCTTESKEKDNIVDFIGFRERIYPIGRLDKDSEGLILMTNNGDLVNRMMRSRYDHEKEYVVTVHRPITRTFIDKMSAGVPILGTMTKKCSVERIGSKKFRIILTQGMNRQIRRMCEHLGYEVTALKRVRILNITLGDLKEGEYRNVTKQERKVLFGTIKDSNETEKTS